MSIISLFAVFVSIFFFPAPTLNPVDDRQPGVQSGFEDEASRVILNVKLKRSLEQVVVHIHFGLVAHAPNLLGNVPPVLVGLHLQGIGLLGFDEGLGAVRKNSRGMSAANQIKLAILLWVIQHCEGVLEGVVAGGGSEYIRAARTG